MILSIPFIKTSIPLNRTYFAIAIVWLFQISAIIGISLGMQEWFISKTPLNLTLQLVLVLWTFSLNTVRNFCLFGILFSIGMLVEWVGVQYGFLFGYYSYGMNLGLKFDGVPLLIGCNWVLLVFITATIAERFFKNSLLAPLFAAFLMVLLDVPMELVAPQFDFWQFSPVAPWNNYLSWFVIAFVMHLLWRQFKVKGDLLFSYHLFISQFLFFTYFAVA